MENKSSLPYRPCVGIVLFNAEGLVWIGRRIPKWDGDASQHMWQMPQGGIDAGETPLEAALRELEEEIGTRNVEVVGESRDWLSYDLPPEVLGVAMKGKYCGQRQKWFAMRFLGSDDEVDIGARPGHKAEFNAWRWVRLEEITDLVVPFKRPVYEVLAREFATLAH